MTLRASAGIIAGGVVAASAFSTAIRTVTTSTSVSATDHTLLVDATSGNLVETLPTAASSTGRIYAIKKIDNTANTVTIQGNGAETIDGTNTKVISTQYTSILLQSNGTAWYILSNN